MSHARKLNSGRFPTSEGNGATLLIRGWTSTLASIVLVLGCALSMKSMLRMESSRQASIEEFSPEQHQSFLARHSSLYYTTRGDETLAELARQLRIIDPDSLRRDNPDVAQVSNNQRLAAGITLQVRYNVGAGE